MKRTRNGFGTRNNEQHAVNIAMRAAKMRKRTTMRARLKEYLISKRAKEDRREPKERKIITVPNRKALRRGGKRGE